MKKTPRHSRAKAISTAPECRDTGHIWLPHDVTAIAKTRGRLSNYLRTLKCPRCETIKKQLLSPSGEIQHTSYIYPPGYTIPGGALTNKDRANIRLRHTLSGVVMFGKPKAKRKKQPKPPIIDGIQLTPDECLFIKLGNSWECVRNHDKHDQHYEDLYERLNDRPPGPPPPKPPTYNARITFTNIGINANPKALILRSIPAELDTDEIANGKGEPVRLDTTYKPDWTYVADKIEEQVARYINGHADAVIVHLGYGAVEGVIELSNGHTAGSFNITYQENEDT